MKKIVVAVATVVAVVGAFLLIYELSSIKLGLNLGFLHGRTFSYGLLILAGILFIYGLTAKSVQEGRPEPTQDSLIDAEKK